MKIRKLLFSAKLEQIEKQNQNIFIFHCTANATQWRLLKNFLFYYGQGPLGCSAAGTKKSELRTLEVLSVRNIVSSVDPAARLSRRGENHGHPRAERRARLSDSLSWLRGYTFFQSTSFKNKLSHTACRKDPPVSSDLRRSCLTAREASSPFGPKVRQDVLSSERSILSAEGGPPGLNTATSQKSLNKKFKPKGCLFFFDTRSNTIFETQQKNYLTVLELVKMLRTLELNNNLILLFGQVKSTVVNHVDLKETLILDAQTTYQQLFFVFYKLSIGLHFCLQQKKVR